MSRILGLIGSGVLLLGAFAPVVSLPVVGTMNLMTRGGDGYFIVAAAVAAAFLAVLGWTRLLLIPGLVGIADPIYLLVTFNQKLEAAKASMAEDLAGNPFAGLAESAVGSVQLQWGVAVLFIGAVLILAAGFMAFAERRKTIQEQAMNA